jgi:hypothetical protein
MVASAAGGLGVAGFFPAVAAGFCAALLVRAVVSVKVPEQALATTA